MNVASLEGYFEYYIVGCRTAARAGLLGAQSRHARTQSAICSQCRKAAVSPATQPAPKLANGDVGCEAHIMCDMLGEEAKGHCG